MGSGYSRVTLDAVRLAEVGLINTVDLGELDALLLESSRRLFIVGRKSLAVTTPREA